MAQWINQTGRAAEQVQDFYPTPGPVHLHVLHPAWTPAPWSGVHPQVRHEKAMQRALLQWKRPDKRPLVEEALHRTGRTDLIGYGPQCLLRPERPHREGHFAPAKAPQRAGKSHAKGAPSSPGTGRNPPAGRGRSGDSSYYASAPRCHCTWGRMFMGSCFSRARG